MHERVQIWIKLSPLQFNPFSSSWYPVSQLQMKLPMVSVQLCSQPPFPASHSSMSMMNNKVFWNQCCCDTELIEDILSPDCGLFLIVLLSYSTPTVSCYLIPFYRAQSFCMAVTMYNSMQVHGFWILYNSIYLINLYTWLFALWSWLEVFVQSTSICWCLQTFWGSVLYAVTWM